MTNFTQEELQRYSRHIILPEVGLEGQQKLKQARVLLVGTGGLGSPSALYLAASGIGKIGLVDFDKVDLSNLHRQVIHGTDDVGRSKIESAARTLQDINPNVTIVPHEVRLTSSNALNIFGEYDIVVDGTDNFPTRYLINDACVILGKPNVYGSIFQFDGQATVFATPDGPCYRCLFPEPPPPGTVPSCAEGGVLGILPGIIGLIQATETIKLILNVGESLVGRLVLYDALGLRFQEVRIKRDPLCPVCGDEPTLKTLIDYEAFCGLSSPAQVREMSPNVLKQKIDRGEKFILIDVREKVEHDISKITGSILIPLGELPNRLKEIDRSLEIVVHCKSGGRSAQALKILELAGYSNVWNLTGGITAWADQVEPEMARY